MKLLAWLIGICVLAVAYYLYFYPTYVHRYRLTIEIEADGKRHVGSTIYEITHKMQPTFMTPGVTHSVTTKGYPVVVDLGQHGGVLSLHNAAGWPQPASGRPFPLPSHQLAMNAYYGKAGMNYDGKRPIFDSLRRARGAKSLGGAVAPFLVWLPNLQNPADARPLPVKDFEQTISPSVRLAGMTLEMTDAPLDDGALQKLSWLAALLERERGRAQPSRFHLRPADLVGTHYDR